MKRFVRLMTHRIKWEQKGGDDDDDDEDSDDDDDDEAVGGGGAGASSSSSSSSGPSSCQLVWRGVMPTRTFGPIKFHDVNNPKEGLKVSF